MLIHGTNTKPANFQGKKGHKLIAKSNLKLKRGDIVSKNKVKESRTGFKP